MGLGDLRRKIGLLLKLNALWGRFQEEKKMGRLKIALGGFAAAFLSYAGAQVLIACPELLAQAPTIVGAGVTAAVMYWMRRPQTGKELGWKLLILGGLAAGWAAIQTAFGAACPAIAANWWGFLSTVALGAVALFLKSPTRDAQPPPEAQG